MDKCPFFSIVIANYNSGLYIEQAIQSILSQSCDDFELIIVDGGSSDNSVDVIQKYNSKISWWVSERDKGQSDAFNKGFAHATGRYLTWLNADDLLLPGVLEKVKRFVEKRQSADWIAINTSYIDKNNIVLSCGTCTDFSNLILRHANVEDVGPSSFFTQELFAKCGPFDINNHYTMDADLWQRFVNEGYRYLRVPGWGWAFRLHEMSKTGVGILGKKSEGQITDEKRMYERNNFKLWYSFVLYQKLKKIFTCYFKRRRLDAKYKGKSIEELKEIGVFN